MVRLVAFHQSNSPLMFAKESVLCIFGLNHIYRIECKYTKRLQSI